MALLKIISKDAKKSFKCFKAFTRRFKRAFQQLELKDKALLICIASAMLFGTSAVLGASITLSASMIKSMVGVNSVESEFLSKATSIEPIRVSIPVVPDIVFADEVEEPRVMTGYVTATSRLNARVSASTDSGIVDQLVYNQEITYTVFNNEWLELENGTYVSSAFVSETPCDYRLVEIPEHKDFKSYMSYKALTAYKQKDLQEVAVDGQYGIRMVNGRCCIAVGTACSDEVGTYVDLILENGVVIPAIVGDVKADIHTQDNNLITAHNDCCSEFIVNTAKMPSEAKSRGNISYCQEDWQSKVVEIKVYDINYFDLQ